VNDTAWEAISIARQCAKEDITNLIGDVTFAYFVVHILVGGKGNRETNPENRIYYLNQLLFTLTILYQKIKENSHVDHSCKYDGKEILC
jgi:hypothetical protein